MASRLQNAASHVKTPAPARMTTRSQAKKLASEAAATSWASSIAPGSSHDPIPSISRKKKTRRPLVKDLTPPINEEPCGKSYISIHGSSSESTGKSRKKKTRRPLMKGLTSQIMEEEQCARKSYISIHGFSSESNGKRKREHIRRASCYKVAEHDGTCVRMNSSRSPSYLPHQTKRCPAPNTGKLHHSETQPTSSNTRSKKEAASTQSSSRKRRCDKSADILPCGNKLGANRASKVRRRLFESTPTSTPKKRALSQAPTCPRESRYEEGSPSRGSPGIIDGNVPSYLRATTQTSEAAHSLRNKELEKTRMTDSQGNNSSPSQPNDQEAKSCRSGHWMPVHYACVLL